MSRDLLILTDVTHAMINYRTPQERAIRKVSLRRLRNTIARAFHHGSMGLELAAIRFIENGGKGP